MSEKKYDSYWGDYYSFRDRTIYERAKNPLMVQAKQNDDGTWFVMISDLYKDWYNPNFSHAKENNNPKVHWDLSDEEFHSKYERIPQPNKL